MNNIGDANTHDYFTVTRITLFALFLSLGLFSLGDYCHLPHKGNYGILLFLLTCICFFPATSSKALCPAFFFCCTCTYILYYLDVNNILALGIKDSTAVHKEVGETGMNFIKVIMSFFLPIMVFMVANLPPTAPITTVHPPINEGISQR